MTQSAAEAAADEVFSAVGEDNLGDESPLTDFFPTRPTHNYI